MGAQSGRRDRVHKGEIRTSEAVTDNGEAKKSAEDKRAGITDVVAHLHSDTSTAEVYRTPPVVLKLQCPYSLIWTCRGDVLAGTSLACFLLLLSPTYSGIRLSRDLISTAMHVI